MKRNTLPLLILFLLGFGVSHAQVFVGYSKNGIMERYPKAIPPESMTDLKNTTTIFAYRPDEADMAAEYEAMFADVWTLTKYKVINANELGDYLDQDGYSFLTIKADQFSMEAYTVIPATHLELWMPFKKGKKVIEPSFGSVHLSPNRAFSGDDRKSMREDHMYGYTQVGWFNWNPEFLGCYLRTMNEWLANGERRSYRYEFRDQPYLADLKDYTLYMPDHVFYEVNGSKANLREMAPNGESMFPYQFDWKAMPMEEIQALAKDAEEPFFLFGFTVVSNAGITSVCEVKSRSQIYQASSLPTGYTLNYRPYAADMTKLFNAIQGR